MNRDQVADVLHILHTADKYHTEITPELELLWWNMYQVYDAQVMFEAAKSWVMSEPAFPSPSEMLDTVRKVQANRRKPARSRAQCDGSGWVEAGERSVVPCVVCNPVLADLMADADKWGKLRNGHSLVSLSDDVMAGSDGKMHAVNSMPNPCQPSTRDDPADPVTVRPVDTSGLF